MNSLWNKRDIFKSRLAILAIPILAALLKPAPAFPQRVDDLFLKGNEQDSGKAQEQVQKFLKDKHSERNSGDLSEYDLSSGSGMKQQENEGEDSGYDQGYPLDGSAGMEDETLRLGETGIIESLSGTGEEGQEVREGELHEYESAEDELKKIGIDQDLLYRVQIGDVDEGLFLNLRDQGVSEELVERIKKESFNSISSEPSTE